MTGYKIILNRHVEAFCQAWERFLTGGENTAPPRIEEAIAQAERDHPGLIPRAEVFSVLLEAEIEVLAAFDRTLAPNADYFARFPEFQAEVEAILRAKLRAPKRSALANDPDIADVRAVLPTPEEMLGPYVKRELLGKGGMGEVWLAEDPKTGVRVAIKTTLAKKMRPQELLRMWRELRTLANLRHPHIVQLFRDQCRLPALHSSMTDEEILGAIQAQPPYLVMEYVPGGRTLANVIAGMRPSFRRIAEIMLGVARAVAFAHEQTPAVYHRDLKPSNILLDGETPKIADFGLAVPEDCQDLYGVAGTRLYMSPEQWRGERDAYGAADVWSMGVIFYQMLTRKLPFRDREEILDANFRPKPLREHDAEIPDEFIQLCDGCLNKEATQRFTAQQVVKLLDHWLSGTHNGSTQLHVMMFTDLVDSAKLKEQLGDADYARSVASPHNRLFREALHRYGGVERDCAGDGFFATFATVSDAVNTALSFHQALREHAWADTICSATNEAGITSRIGIHLGEAAVVDGENGDKPQLVSQAQDMCARLMSLGGGGQTLLTRAAFDNARQYIRQHPCDAQAEHEPDSEPTPLAWQAHGRYRFHGKDEPMEVFEVGAVGFAPLTPPANSAKAQRVLALDEEQTLGWRPGTGLEIPRKAGWFIEKKLGEGGFGEVWLARHQRTKERRVFKFCFDADRLRSFKRELTFFRIIKEELGDRPDIVRLYDVQVDAPPFFLESDYVPCGNLQHWADEQGGIAQVPLTVRVRLLAGIAQAVGAAHSLGIIHKDLKPSNVLIAERRNPEDRHDGSNEPQPLLADFGIGVLADRSVLDRRQITATGFTESLLINNNSSRTGTRLYAPPETLVGKPASTAGDVYALGVMLYQLVIGDFNCPLGIGWERRLAAVSAADGCGENAMRYELLQEDIRQCVEDDPTNRLISAAELANRLLTLDARAAKLNAQRRAERRSKRLKQAIGAFVVVVVAAAGWAAVAHHRWEEARRNDEAALNQQEVDGCIASAKRYRPDDIVTPLVEPTLLDSEWSSPDYSGFTIVRTSLYNDLSHWKPIPAGATPSDAGRVEPALFSRVIDVIRKENVSQNTSFIAFQCRTEGFDVDLHCPDRRYTLLGSKRRERLGGTTKPVTVREIRIDISDVPPGDMVRIVVQGTIWNGFQYKSSKKQWAGFLAPDNLSEGELAIRFPPGRKPKRPPSLQAFAKGSPVTEAPAHTQNFNNPTNEDWWVWRPRDIRRDFVYQIEWDWEPLGEDRAEAQQP